MKRRNWALWFALGFALVNRFELCVVMLSFIVAGSRINPWRQKRFATLLLLVVFLNFAVPFFGGGMLARRFVEAESANTIAMLDQLQMKYLYIVAVIPKVAENLFGHLLNPVVWRDPTRWLIVNLFNNISFVIVLFVALIKRSLTLRNDLVYFAAFGSLIVAQSLAVQPRYFQFVYVLICLQIAQQKSESWAGGSPRAARSMNRNLLARLRLKEGQYVL